MRFNAALIETLNPSRQNHGSVRSHSSFYVTCFLSSTSLNAGFADISLGDSQSGDKLQSDRMNPLSRLQDLDTTPSPGPGTHKHTQGNPHTHKHTHTQHPQLSRPSQLIYRLAFENACCHILTGQGKGRVRLFFILYFLFLGWSCITSDRRSNL